MSTARQMKYYLYRHIRLDKNIPFYIGIGTKRKTYRSYSGEYSRAFDRIRRNIFWKRIIEKTDYTSEILMEFDTYEEVQLKEMELIKLYGRRDIGTGSLVNLT